MKIRKMLTLVALCVAGNISAQVTIRDVFKDMPIEIVPYLEENNKLDLIDFLDSGMKAVVSNALDGKTTMDSMTDSFIHLSLSNSYELSMKLLDVTQPVDSTNQIVCLVKTYGVDIHESIVEFYSVKWNKLSTEEYLTMPKGIWTATFDEVNPILTLNSENWLDRPANAEQKENQRKSIILKWNGYFVNEN